MRIALVSGFIGISVVSGAACAPPPAPSPTTAPAAATTKPSAPASPATVASPAAAPSPSPSPSASPTANTPADQLTAAARRVEAAVQALQAGDAARARREFEEFDEDWEKIEDGIKAKSPQAYKDIEDAMDDVEAALVKPPTPDVTAATAALPKLRDAINRSLPALR